jgi:hypothetical protein
MNDHRTSGDHDSRYARLAGGSTANFSTMPQVGGDPVVESGSNSDGSWTRWADGTQVCHSVRSTTFSATTSSELRRILNWNFPLAFTINPNVLIGGYMADNVNGANQGLVTYRAAENPDPNTTTAKFDYRSITGSIVSRIVDAQVFAIGRWK